jgi:aldehyde:ferredoxin oxidoreductase
MESERPLLQGVGGPADDTLPPRFFEQPLPEGGTKGRTMNKERLTQMVREYYRLRGWDSRYTANNVT